LHPPKSNPLTCQNLASHFSLLLSYFSPRRVHSYTRVPLNFFLGAFDPSSHLALQENGGTANGPSPCSARNSRSALTTRDHRNRPVQTGLLPLGCGRNPSSASGSFPLQLGSLRLLFVVDAQSSDAASRMYSFCLLTNIRSESLTEAGTTLLKITGSKRPSNARTRQWSNAVTWRVIMVCPQPRH